MDKSKIYMNKEGVMFPPDIGNSEDKVFEREGSMIRLQHKDALLACVEVIFKRIGRSKAVFPRAVVRVTKRSVLRDYKKGLKKINRRVPVYVELPQFKREGNGMYSKQYGKSDTAEKEITVTDISRISQPKDYGSPVPMQVQREVIVQDKSGDF